MSGHDDEGIRRSGRYGTRSLHPDFVLRCETRTKKVITTGRKKTKAGKGSLYGLVEGTLAHDHALERARRVEIYAARYEAGEAIRQGEELD